MRRSSLSGLTRRRAVPLIAVVALTGGLLTQNAVGSPLGAPKTPHPKFSSVKGAKVPKGAVRPLGLPPAHRKPTAAPEPGARRAAPTRGPVAVMLELDTSGSIGAYRRTASHGKAAAKAAARAQHTRIAGMQNRVVAEMARLAPTSHVLYRAHNLVAGVAVLTDTKNLAALARISGVRNVLPITPKRISNARAVPLIGSGDVWENLGDTGQDTTVGVIDTGIDYTHADFGGTGTTGAFDDINPENADGDFPTEKVIGGEDFAGDNYNADPLSDNYNPVPNPDDNPIDCRRFSVESNIGHGTHVAGSLAGFGVDAEGDTYGGDYDTDTPFTSMDIAPGVAPEASLYALRVFGCEGSTNLVGEALDYAADPNNDDDPSDRLDVVNMSLGSDFASPEDFDAQASNDLSQLGTVVVAASGNAGDLYDAGGSPGNAARAISVAASDDGYAVTDALDVTNADDSDLEGNHYGLLSDLYDYANKDGIDSVALAATLPDNLDGCNEFSGDDQTAVNEKVAVLYANEFSDCDSVTRTDNAQDAGALGVVIIDDNDSLETGIYGNTDIPAILVGKTVGDQLVADGDVTVTFGEVTRGILRLSATDNTDMAASFSSRGTHGDGSLKPDVTAPGVTVFSADAGAGDSGKSLSGTSMATPMVAGEAALVRSRHPDWSPEDVKADIMNTALSLLHTGTDGSGDMYGPGRVGAGRVEADAALASPAVAYSRDDHGAVSVSFGPVAVPPTASVEHPFTVTKTVRVVNKSVLWQAYGLEYQDITDVPGVSYRVIGSHHDVGLVAAKLGPRGKQWLSSHPAKPAQLPALAGAPGPAANRRPAGPRADESPSPSGADEYVVLSPRGMDTFTVTLRVTDPTALTKVLDPTMDAKQAGVSRQYIAEASGRVWMNPWRDVPPMIVPVYSAPRPASDMAAREAHLTAGPVVAGADDLRGDGIDQGDAGERITSVVSAYALEATSTSLPGCTDEKTEQCTWFDDEKAADVRYVGATTDSPQIVADGGDKLTDSTAYFGLSTYGTWRDPGGLPTDLEVIIDRDANGTADEELFTTRYPGTDLLGTMLWDFQNEDYRTDNNGDNFWFLNGVDGSVDTDLLDSDSVMLPAPLSAIGITSLVHRFKYGIATFSLYHNQALDMVGLTGSKEDVTAMKPALTIDGFRPAIAGTDGDDPNVLVQDTEDADFSIRKDVPSYKIDKPLGMLLIHHHNQDGERAQVVKVKQPSAPVISLSASRVRAGTRVTATVTIPSDAGPVPSGTVEFRKLPGVAIVRGTLSSVVVGGQTYGKVSVVLPPFSRGPVILYAYYYGDDSYLLSYTSNQITLTNT